MAEWGWSGQGGNAPVGARLFGPGAPSVITPPSLAAQAEMARIQALYGLGGAPVPQVAQQPLPPAAPTPPLNVLEQALAGEPTYLPPQLSPETQAALGAPVAPQNMPPGAQPVPPMSWQGFLDTLPQTRPAPASLPGGLDPSQTGAPVAPQESAQRMPHGTAMAMAWRDFLGSMYSSVADRMSPWQSATAGGTTTGSLRPGAATTPATPEQTTAAGVPVPTRLRSEEPAPYMAPENYSSAPPSPPATPATEQNALAGVSRGRPYARLDLRQPDYASVMREYDLSRPQPYQEGPNDRTMRLVAAALAGGLGGSPNDPLAPLGAISGLSRGYATETDRDRAVAERDEERRVGFQRGRAGLMGDQENNRWQTGFQQQTFDRASQGMEDADTRAREALELQRGNAGLSQMLTRMRIAALARAAGHEVGPAQILSQGLEYVVSNPGTQLLITDDQGRTRPLTFREGNEELTIAQLSNRLMQRRGSPAAARDNPLFATNPNMAIQQNQRDLSDLLMSRILSLPPQQQQQILRQLAPMLEGRRRAGTTRLAEDSP